MNIEELREYCLSIGEAEECFPFDDTVLVFKVENKMFAYISIIPEDDGFRVNLKCDPDLAIELREKYESVIPGYHANKKYWNTVYLDGDMENDEIKSWVDHSVEEVLKKLPKKQREAYYAKYKE